MAHQKLLEQPAVEGSPEPTVNVRLDGPPEGPDCEPEILLQPETRPISHEQLVVEVKGIYAALVMVEAKCIDIDEKHTAAVEEKDPLTPVALRNDQWQALIALHKQLLLEHHDFFLASQHPSTRPALSRLAAKYAMPARMWRHGIHAFLEVLRHRLPDSLEHRVAFIYIAYNMMALLYETGPSFKDTYIWIEYLGDLGRYRVAIEHDEPKSCEVWSNVARFWYNQASGGNPTVGRLHHHLAILTRLDPLVELSLYLRALTCLAPFESARASVMTLFNPVLSKDARLDKSSLETMFTMAHGILFTATSSDRVSDSKYEFGHDIPITDQIYDPDPTTIAASRYVGLSSISACSIARADARSKEGVLNWGAIMNLASRVSGFFWCMLQSVSDSQSIPGKLTTLTICMHFVRPSVARTISNNGGNEHQAPSSAFATPTAAAWPCIGFTATVLLAAHTLARVKGPVPVWGSMMTMFAFAWWGTRDDLTTTLWLSGTIFIVWAYSAYCYGYATFQKLRIHSSVTLIVLLVAILLDVLAAKLMTPMEASTAQSDPMLDLSLPCASLSLTVMVNVVPWLRQPPAEDAQLDMEFGSLTGDRTVQLTGLIPDCPPPPPIEAAFPLTELPSG
ncbi:hypothetical protein N7G274_002492 [Stereocaulon virgatum]|uniref:DNA/RNA-binding domain-containing protein n=1 Tax=Stereocaulon virgatum TaxID=373712 RepID=A0ABR4AHZ6_9LECA